MKTVKLNGDNVVVLFWNRFIRATNEFDLIFFLHSFVPGWCGRLSWYVDVNNDFVFRFSF